MYVEVKARATIYKLLIKFIYLNQQWYIDEYDQKENAAVDVWQMSYYAIVTMEITSLWKKSVLFALVFVHFSVLNEQALRELFFSQCFMQF